MAKGSNIEDFLKELDELETLIPSPFETQDTLKSLRERIDWLYAYLSQTGGGNANRDIKVDGANVLRPFTDINLIAGTNVTISTSANQTTKYTDMTISASGGGATIETPTGTVNASNTTFTPTAEPQYVVADGVTYFDGAGYTWSAPDITMDVPPSQYIRAFI